MCPPFQDGCGCGCGCPLLCVMMMIRKRSHINHTPCCAHLCANEAPFNFSANVERSNAVSSYLLTVTCLHTRKSDCPESKVNPWKHGLQFGRGLQLRFLIFSLVQLAAIIQLSCEHLFCPFCFSNAFFLFFIFFSFWIGLWLKKRIEAVVHRLLSC